MQSDELQIGGFVPFTTVDFPGKLSAVVFCQGCPWRCAYCHNAHLQPFEKGNLHWQDVIIQLCERRGFLDAVVFSGGEPTAQSALLQCLKEVRELGYLIGLHTAGMHPQRLQKALGFVDWVGFDVKAPFDKRYDQLTGRAGSADLVLESLQLLVESGVNYQIRTTLDPAILNDAACSDLSRFLRALGLPTTHWQHCRPVRAVHFSPSDLSPNQGNRS